MEGSYFKVTLRFTTSHTKTRIKGAAYDTLTQKKFMSITFCRMNSATIAQNYKNH